MLERASSDAWQKNRHRWQTARDLELELKWLAEGGSQTSLAPADLTRDIRARGEEALLWGAVSLLLAAITSFVIWNLKPSPLPPPVSAHGDYPAARSASCRTRSTRRGSFARRRSCRLMLPSKAPHSRFTLRAMDTWMPGHSRTEAATSPFFSPDGQWLGFFAGNRLKKVSVRRGRGAHSWRCCVPWRGQLGSRGMIAFAPAWSSVLRQVSDAGGTPQPLTRFEKREFSHRWPRVPAGR